MSFSVSEGPAQRFTAVHFPNTVIRWIVVGLETDTQRVGFFARLDQDENQKPLLANVAKRVGTITGNTSGAQYDFSLIEPTTSLFVTREDAPDCSTNTNHSYFDSGAVIGAGAAPFLGGGWVREGIASVVSYSKFTPAGSGTPEDPYVCVDELNAPAWAPFINLEECTLEVLDIA